MTSKRLELDDRLQLGKAGYSKEYCTGESGGDIQHLGTISLDLSGLRQRNGDTLRIVGKKSQL
jgi:hypothetical protein